MTDSELSNLVSEEVLLEFLNEELDCDLAFFARMFEIFKGFIKDLHDLGCDSEQDNIRRLAHKMRASSLSFGAHALEKKLHELEYGEPSSVVLEEAQEIAVKTEQAILQFYESQLQESQQSA